MFDLNKPHPDREVLPGFLGHGHIGHVVVVHGQYLGDFVRLGSGDVSKAALEKDSES